MLAFYNMSAHSNKADLFFPGVGDSSVSFNKKKSERSKNKSEIAQASGKKKQKNARRSKGKRLEHIAHNGPCVRGIKTANATYPPHDQRNQAFNEHAAGKLRHLEVKKGKKTWWEFAGPENSHKYSENPMFLGRHPKIMEGSCHSGRCRK